VFVFGAATGATPFTALLDEVPPAPSPAMSADDRAVLLYSSGTTGLLRQWCSATAT
jgi:acyl-coenzyme A synthetase/AMP-(fatty) acid ligase